jgi:hypothetical protein
VVGDETELGVEGDVFGEVAHGVVGFGAEHRSGLIDPLEDTNHDLFVELR